MAVVPTPSCAFASDNTAPAHPKALAAILEADHGAVPSYGDDALTQRAKDRIRDAFDSPDAEVLFAYTGTGANIIGLTSGIRPWHEILCSDIAHVYIDEAGGPVRISGAVLTPLPSDDGITIAIAAAARGATVIEKHFTLDKSLPGPDHNASILPTELADMVRGIREVERALGDGLKIPRASEIGNMSVARKVLVAARDIARGATLTPDDISVLRAGSGLSPMMYWSVLGTVASRAFAKGDPIQ